jgi:hypothetical protein
MRRVLIITAALVAFAATTGTAAASTSKADKREAKQECRAERGTTDATREAFKAKYGGFGHCLHQEAREAKAERKVLVVGGWGRAPPKAAHRHAVKDCRDERGDTDESVAAFREKYGTNTNKKNAFGKCVSQSAKAEREDQDQEDAAEAADTKNAAQECDTERSADRKAFEDKYGTNHNKKNAFGKCVSQKSDEDDGDGEDDGS